MVVIRSTETLYLMGGVSFVFGDPFYGWVMLGMGVFGALLRFGLEAQASRGS